MISFLFVFQLISSADPLVESQHIKNYTHTSIENRLCDLKKLRLNEQPLFIQKNPTVTLNNLVEGICVNNDIDTLQTLVDFFNHDPKPIYTENQLKEFLDSDSITASTWRNLSSDRCIITVNSRRFDSLYLSIEHEITHVIQHADVKHMSESDFIRTLHKSLEDMCPEALAEIYKKYENYLHKIAIFDNLSDKEKFEIRQVLLEYCADIQGCLLLKNHVETVQFLKEKLDSKRPHCYASYKLLYNIIV